MNKIVKSYFLFFSEHPIMYNFIGIALNFIYLTVVNHDAGPLKDVSAPKFYHLINIIFFLNIILVYFVSSRFITRKRNDIASGFEDYTDREEWFRAVVSENGEIIIVDKPIWGKGKVFFVRNPHEDFEQFNFIQDLKGRYRNTNMNIKVSIELESDLPCDKKEIFKCMHNRYLEENKTGNCLLLNNYMDYVFKKFNDKLQPELDLLANRYALREISEPYVLDKVIDMLVFPEKIFSHVKNVKLCLGNLKFSSCKGMVDCSA